MSGIREGGRLIPYGWTLIALASSNSYLGKYPVPTLRDQLND
jgi:hypothetical protein